MRVRLVIACLAVALVAGCGSSGTTPTPVSIAAVDPRPAGIEEATDVATTDDEDCNREASLRPAPSLPEPGAMPPGSSMAAIVERGRLIVGVDQNQFLFGYRNPATGQLEGFDIDIAREIAMAIFGNPDSIELKVVGAADRETMLESGEVDLIARTFSISCARKEKVAFSSVYFYADQRILVSKGSEIFSGADLSGKKGCAVTGTTSLVKLAGLNPNLTVFGASQWPDCLVMLQQGQIDVIGTDYVVLAGLAAQDPNVEVVGPSISVEPYGIGVNKNNEDLVRFVNGVLARIRADGTWERLYADRLAQDLGPSPGPPDPRYVD